MSRQSDYKSTKQVRIDSLLHQQLKIRAAKYGKTIRHLIEDALDWIPKEKLPKNEEARVKGRTPAKPEQPPHTG